MIEVGRPGAHAGAVANRNRTQMLGAALIAIGAIRWLNADERPPTLDVITLLGAIGVLWRHLSSHAARAGTGRASERRVATVLRTSGAAAVLHGVDLGAGGDADHVVVGPWLAVVETKTGRGAVTVRGDAVDVGGKVLPRNPFRQARQQAAQVHQATGVWCDTIVCITDATIPVPVRVDQTVLCSLASLPAALRLLAPRVNRADVSALAATLGG